MLFIVKSFFWQESDWTCPGCFGTWNEESDKQINQKKKTTNVLNVTWPVMLQDKIK